MSPLPSFANDTVTRLRGTPTTDEYGNDTLDWSAPAELPVTGCSVQPASTSEVTGDREAITTRWTWYMPPGADVAGTDRASWRGEVYQIDGDVQVWESPTGALDHQVCSLSKVKG